MTLKLKHASFMGGLNLTRHSNTVQVIFVGMPSFSSEKIVDSPNAIQTSHEKTMFSGGLKQQRETGELSYSNFFFVFLIEVFTLCSLFTRCMVLLPGKKNQNHTRAKRCFNPR